MVGIAKDTRGRVLKPSKKDMAGESGAVRTLVLDADTHALSSAAAIKAMLAHDVTKGAAEEMPLFRYPQTDREITYAKAAELFCKKLTEAGYAEMATGIHSLRAGGATDYANSNEGGMLFQTAMGGWSSEAYRRYIWSC